MIQRSLWNVSLKRHAQVEILHNAMLDTLENYVILVLVSIMMHSMLDLANMIAQLVGQFLTVC